MLSRVVRTSQESNFIVYDVCLFLFVVFSQAEEIKRKFGLEKKRKEEMLKRETKQSLLEAKHSKNIVSF